MIFAGAQSVPVPILALAVVAAVFVVYCWVDLVRADLVRGLPKWAWAIICVVSILIDGTIYLAVERKR